MKTPSKHIYLLALQLTQMLKDEGVDFIFALTNEEVSYAEMNWDNEETLKKLEELIETKRLEGFSLNATGVSESISYHQ